MQSRKQNSIKPVQLISFDADKRLILSQQAIKIFESLQAEQLHIVTVAGKYRTGKSYILNRVLLNQNNGFQVGPTINACTKGLWMWPKIVEIQSGQKKKKCIIIDTQGLGSLQQGQNTDIKIFLMAILLSSYLIYNSVGSIDEKALQNLSLVISLAQLLHKNDNLYDSQQLINSFPSFMWLVRDFSLRLQTQSGQAMTSSQYLQNALRIQNGTSQAAERKNNIRKKLKTFFQDRNCFTLIRPTQNEKDLQNLSALPQRKLRPDFVRLISQFKQTIYSGLKPKRVRGKPVTPQGFIELCKYFVNTINSGKLPSINSHWDNLCLKEASRIIDLYINQHSKKLTQSFLQEDQPEQKIKKVQTKHSQILKQAYLKIDKSFLGKLQKQLSKQRLEKMLAKVYDNVIKQINQKRYNFVKDIINDIFSEIIDEFQNKKIESFQEIFARFQEIKQKYKHDNRIYQSFYQNSKDVFKEFLKNLKTQWQRQQSILHQKNDFLESKIAQKTQQMRQKLAQSNQLVRQLQAKNYRMQLQKTQLQILNQDLKKQLILSQQQNSKLIEDIDELQVYRQNFEALQAQQQKSNLSKQINFLRSQKTKIQIQLVEYKQLYKESHIKQRKIQREAQIFKSKCSQYLKQNIQLTEKIEKMNKKFLQYEQNQRKNMIKDIRQEKQVPQIMQNLNTKINELEIKLNMKEQQNRNLQSLMNNQKLTHQILLRAPQNLNYNVLKKNYEMQKQINQTLQSKIKNFEFILSLCSLKCLVCQKNIDKSMAKAHVSLCSQTISIAFDVSYEYNGNGQIQFVVDVHLEDYDWTVRKSFSNIKHFFKKMCIENDLFINVDNLEDDITQNEERRVFLDEIFNNCREDIWSNTFLIEYFGIDIQFLNRSSQKFKNGQSMRSSKISLDLQHLSNQNIDPYANNMLMKTTKFSKKTFNFGHI